MNACVCVWAIYVLQWFINFIRCIVNCCLATVHSKTKPLVVDEIGGKWLWNSFSHYFLSFRLLFLFCICLMCMWNGWSGGLDFLFHYNSKKFSELNTNQPTPLPPSSTHTTHTTMASLHLQQPSNWNASRNVNGKNVDANHADDMNGAATTYSFKRNKCKQRMIITSTATTTHKWTKKTKKNCVWKLYVIKSITGEIEKTTMAAATAATFGML